MQEGEDVRNSPLNVCYRANKVDLSLSLTPITPELLDSLVVEEPKPAKMYILSKSHPESADGLITFTPADDVDIYLS